VGGNKELRLGDVVNVSLDEMLKFLAVRAL
jgi:hypothetical protein